MTNRPSAADQSPDHADLCLYLVAPDPAAARAASPRNPDSEPWPDTVDVTAADDPAGLTEAVRRILDEAQAPLVGFSGRLLSSAAMTPRLTHGTKLAAQCGLDEAPFPLLVLAAWNDLRVLAIYRDWVRERHADAMTTLAPALDAYLQLLPYRSFAASLDGIDVRDDDTLLLTGTCRRGASEGATPPPEAITLTVADLDDKPHLTVTTTPELRVDAGVRRWTGFSAVVRVADLPVGRIKLVVEAETPPGFDPLSKRVTASIGLSAASRPIVVGGRRLQPVPVASGDAHLLELVIREADGLPARLAWSWSMAMHDAKAAARRQPFAWVRLVRFLTRPFVRKPIWLVGERADTARDNGYHVFSHLRRERHDIRAYYVIDKDCEQRERVAGFGHVVAHSSWRHRLLMLHAEVLANAYSIKHMVPRQWDGNTYMRQFAWRVGAYRAYLNHGVDVDTNVLRRRVGGYDMYVTTMAREAAAARATSGYDEQVVQAGLARYDALIPTPESRTILFMPTWRQYLVAKLFSSSGEGAMLFEGSAYQRFITGFLTSERLAGLLERYDYRLKFMPHYNLRNQLSDVPVGSERISVLSGASANIQDVMLECDLFVTDHSSVHFDIAYLGTPLIYSHFDNADYRAFHATPSWFDHERDGFGPVVDDLDSTIDAIAAYLAGGCRREAMYDERAAEAFTFRDRDNARRNVAAIEALRR